MTILSQATDDVLAAGNHADAHGRMAARSVALVGFMGVGKSSVGRELAMLLDRPFVDTDAVVEERAGKSVPELFAEGEAVFRRLERDVVREALARPPSVLALGGGAFTQPGLADDILAHALVVHLYTPWSILRRRLTELAVDRPLIRGRTTGQIQDLFLARGASYRRAHVRVCLSRSGVTAAATAVAEVLRWRPEAEPPSKHAEGRSARDGSPEG